MILEAYAMVGFVNGSSVAPNLFLKDNSGSFTNEPKNREQALFTFINSTLSPSVLAITVGQKSAKGVWNTQQEGLILNTQQEGLILKFFMYYYFNFLWIIFFMY